LRDWRVRRSRPVPTQGPSRPSAAFSACLSKSAPGRDGPLRRHGACV
jgi:hypothetical protein